MTAAYQGLKIGGKLLTGTAESGAVGVVGLAPELCEAANRGRERLN